MNLSLKAKLAILFIILFALFLILNLTNFSKEVKQSFYVISSPIQKAFWQIGDRTSNFLSRLSISQNLGQENEFLRTKIKQLTVKNIALKELAKENEFLRQALNLGLEKEFNLVLIEVIAKDIFEETILINKGEQDGLLKKQPIITREKVLVGHIDEVYKNFSKVMLISNKKSSFDAEVQDREAVGLIKGGGGNKLSMELLPKEKEIAKDDLVITTSLSKIFPKGLLIGRIKEIKKSDLEPFQQADVQPFFSINEISNLFVITN